MSSYLEHDPFPPRPRLRLVVAARSDRGIERAGNEDAACIVDLMGGRAFVPPASTMLDAHAGAFAALVCDGMGGEEGGEVASHLAVLTIVESLREAWARGPLAPLGAALVKSIDAASRRIKREAVARPRLARMGTTATLAAFGEHGLICAQVGDSRAYVLRRGSKLTQITRDQTLLDFMRRNGTLTGEELDGIGSNVILQAVGSSTHLEIPLTETPIAEGDIVLLCSDGLTGVVDDARIEAILRQHDPERACEALVASANDRGGPDNVTCVVLHVVSGAHR